MSFNLSLIETPEAKEFGPIKLLFQKIGFDDAITRKTVVGSLRVDSNMITVNMIKCQREIHLKNCKGVHIHYEGYEREVYRSRTRPFTKISMGDRNKIKLVLQNESVEFYIWLKNKYDKRSLKVIIDWCYNHRIQIKEYYRGIRTFKWTKIDYKTIQEVKKRYGILEW